MDTMLKSTITIFSENKPGVLFRIANMFLRRKINIESLTVSEIKTEGLSRFTIVVKEDFSIVRKIATQLRRIVEVYDVQTHLDDELVYKEIALLKVQVKNKETYEKIESLAYQFDAEILYREDSVVVLQKVGSEGDIDFLRNTFEQFGIKELVRSGRVALEKGKIQKTKAFSAKLKNLSRTAAAIEVSVIKRIELEARRQDGVVSLAQGTPSFFTAKHIKDAAKKAMDKNLTDKYTPGYGIAPLREALAKKVAKFNGIKTKPEEIIVAHGGIEALMAIFMALLNVEDEIIVLTPDYASHLTQITIAMHGTKPVYVPLVESGKEWKLDAEKLENAVTPHTKAILFTNPCNPTGKVFTKDELKQIAAIAKKYNLYIITDEMYEHLLFDGKNHISIGSFKEVADQTISVFGVSKSYAMTGWRIGYIVANKKLIDEIFKIHDSLITCPTAISQYAALAAITGPQDIVEEYRKTYEKRRAIVLKELAKTDKIEYAVPSGAYYAFVKFKKPVDDNEIAFTIMKKAKVAVVPGSPFGLGGEGHVRLSFCFDDEIVREGTKRFVKFVNENL